MENTTERLNEQKAAGNGKWKLFAPLMLLAVVASIAGVPYLIEITQVTQNKASGWELAPGIIFERVFLSSIAICIGLTLGPKVGLRAPAINAMLSGEPWLQRWRAILAPSLVCGIGISLLICIADPWLESVVMPELPESVRHAEAMASDMPWWKPLLASFSAGVTEELWFRFGLMSFLAWLGTKVARQRSPGAYILWIANIVAALMFGLLHLTNVIELSIPITMGVVFYVIVWNGIGGMVFGWLYWHRGLEAAMLAHIVTDVMLQVAVPMFKAIVT